MRSARVVLAACALAATATPVLAQPAGQTCVQLVRQTTGNEFKAGDAVIVRGPAGCADPQVAVEVLLGRRLLSRSTSRADGSYQSTKAFLPTDVSAGADVIRAVTTRAREQTEYVRPISVTAAATNQAPEPTPEARGERNLLLVVIWVTVAIVIGAGLVVARRREIGSRRARQATPATPLLVPDPEATGFFDIDAQFEPEPEPIVAADDDWEELDLPSEPVGAAPIRTPDHVGFDRPPAPVYDGSTSFAALVEDEPAPADAGAPGSSETDQEIDAVLKRASDESADVIGRLRDEIASWTRSGDEP